MTEFLDKAPISETYWRAIILFGRNVASYKLSLGKALIELADKEVTFVSLEALGEPFSRHLCEHLKNNDKQATSRSSQFLETCHRYNQGDISQDEMLGTTARRPFLGLLNCLFSMSAQPMYKCAIPNFPPCYPLCDRLCQPSRIRLQIW